MIIPAQAVMIMIFKMTLVVVVVTFKTSVATSGQAETKEAETKETRHGSGTVNGLSGPGKIREPWTPLPFPTPNPCLIIWGTVRVKRSRDDPAGNRLPRYRSGPLWNSAR